MYVGGVEDAGSSSVKSNCARSWTETPQLRRKEEKTKGVLRLRERRERGDLIEVFKILKAPESRVIPE